MPPKAARKSFKGKIEIDNIALHRKCTPSFYLSRIAGFFFLSFFRKLRKRKENPTDPANPVK